MMVMAVLGRDAVRRMLHRKPLRDGGRSSMGLQEKSAMEPALWGAFVVESLGIGHVRLCDPMTAAP